MPYIILDVETNGVYVYKYPKGHELAGQPYPADGPGQARVAEIGIIYCDDDFNVEREYHAYIQPDGWEMTPETTAINGLETDELMLAGIPIVEALTAYHCAIAAGRVVVAFNAQFDCKALRGEARRAGLDDMFDQTYNICTMRSAMKLEPKVRKLSGKGGFPKLSDVAAHFNIPQPHEHGALEDARVTVEVAKALKEAGVLLAPDVHRAKLHPNEEAVI